MALQQAKGDSASESVDDEIYIRVGAKLAALHRALEDQPRYLPSPFGELGQKRGARLGIDLGFGDEAAEGRTGDRSRLQMHHRIGNLPEIARNMSCVGDLQFAVGQRR
jgi:hypothetical protein